MKNILFEAFINDLVTLGEAGKKPAQQKDKKPENAKVSKGGRWYTADPKTGGEYVGRYQGPKWVNATPAEKAQEKEKVTGDAGAAPQPAQAPAQAQQPTKPQATKDEVPDYLQGRSGAFSGVVGSATEITIKRPDGSEVKLPVRRVLDKSGNPIDVATSEGRAAASKRLDERIRESQKVTIRALKDFPKNILASQWVGEIGELHALKELLDQDVEAYMATASNPESDLIKVDRDESKGLTIVEISAKSTKKESGAAGRRGSNARAPFTRMAEGKQLTIKGIEGTIPAETAINTVYDVREQLGNMLTDGMAVEVPGERDRALELTDEELKRCTEEYRRLYNNPDTIVGGKPVRRNFAEYERNRIIQNEDIDNLRMKMLKDVDESKTKTDEEKEKEKLVVEHYIERLRDPKAGMVGKPLSELQQKTIDDIGEIFDNTDPPTDLVIDSDLVVIRFNTQTGVPEVKIAKWESVKDCIDEKENSSRETTVGQRFPNREVDPELANQSVGDVIDAECNRPGGGEKWKCQFNRYIKHSFQSQARLRRSKGGQPRRGYIQLKLNWSPPKNCVEVNLKGVADYVKG